MENIKSDFKRVTPEAVWNALYSIKKMLRGIVESLLGIMLRLILKAAQAFGLNTHVWKILRDSKDLGLSVFPSANYYSPLPEMDNLKKNLKRWCKPSEMVGVSFDIEEMKQFLKDLEDTYSDEYTEIMSYKHLEISKFGPGFTRGDARLLYYMIRHTEPKRYIEVGSGLSTKYSSLAAEQNEKIGKPFKMTCIEPYPYDSLYSIKNVDIMKQEVQNVDLSFFDQLDSGDVLFIDSTHIVKIDSDVAFLFLEVLPRLRKGVKIHIHDINFPYNVPYPSELYIFGKRFPQWPWFFNEPMLLQAFLSFNDAYNIIASIPLVSFFDEQFLCDTISEYRPFSEYTEENLDKIGFPPCSLWLEKVK